MSPFIVLLSVVLTNAFMQLVKKVSGMRSANNNAPVYLGGFLAASSLFSVLATSYFTGNQIDPNQVSEWVNAITLAAITYFASSGMYDKVWKWFVK